MSHAIEESLLAREVTACRAADPAFARWAAGYGVIRHIRQALDGRRNPAGVVIPAPRE